MNNNNNEMTGTELVEAVRGSMRLSRMLIAKAVVVAQDRVASSMRRLHGWARLDAGFEEVVAGVQAAYVAHMRDFAEAVTAVFTAVSVPLSEFDASTENAEAEGWKAKFDSVRSHDALARLEPALALYKGEDKNMLKVVRAAARFEMLRIILAYSDVFSSMQSCLKFHIKALNLAGAGVDTAPAFAEVRAHVAMLGQMLGGFSFDVDDAVKNDIPVSDVKGVYDEVAAVAAEAGISLSKAMFYHCKTGTLLNGMPAALKAKIIGYLVNEDDDIKDAVMDVMTSTPGNVIMLLPLLMRLEQCKDEELGLIWWGDEKEDRVLGLAANIAEIKAGLAKAELELERLSADAGNARDLANASGADAAAIETADNADAECKEKAEAVDELRKNLAEAEAEFTAEFEAAQ